MAYIQERQGKDGKPNFRVQVRLRGYPVQTATSLKAQKQSKNLHQ